MVENFPTVIDRAEKVAEARRCIVALALQGDLLSPSGPAAHSSAGSPAPSAVNELHPLPESWNWVTLGTLIASGPRNGYSPKGVGHETPVRVLTLSATTSSRFDGRHFKYVDEVVPQDSELWLRDGDVLVQRGNTIEYVGVAAVYRGPSQTFIYPDLMMKFRLSERVDLDFGHMALNGPAARTFIESRASGTSGSMPKINQATLLNIPIPLPPLAEQKRIVAKVEHLMKLCDDLEAKLRRAEDRASKLVEAVVREMVA